MIIILWFCFCSRRSFLLTVKKKLGKCVVLCNSRNLVCLASCSSLGGHTLTITTNATYADEGRTRTGRRRQHTSIQIVHSSKPRVAYKNCVELFYFWDVCLVSEESKASLVQSLHVGDSFEKKTWEGYLPQNNSTVEEDEQCSRVGLCAI